MPNQIEEKLKGKPESKLDVVETLKVGAKSIKEKGQGFLLKTNEEVSRFLKSLLDYKKEGADWGPESKNLEIETKNAQQLEQAQMDLVNGPEKPAVLESQEVESKKFNLGEFRRIAESTPLAKKLMQ